MVMEVMEVQPVEEQLESMEVVQMAVQDEPEDLFIFEDFSGNIIHQLLLMRILQVLQLV